MFQMGEPVPKLRKNLWNTENMETSTEAIRYRNKKAIVAKIYDLALHQGKEWLEYLQDS